MSESEKYHCDECKKELHFSFVGFQKMLKASYELKMQNNKLIEFVKTMSNEENSILGMKDFYVPYARRVLKEIGQL